MLSADSVFSHSLAFACVACTQSEGVSPEEHRRIARELAEAQRKCISSELELRAALDKLDVYKRTEPAVHATDQPGHDGAAVAATALAKGLAADEGKDEHALRSELGHLRHVVAQDAEELDKVIALGYCKHHRRVQAMVAASWETDFFAVPAECHAPKHPGSAYDIYNC